MWRDARVGVVVPAFCEEERIGRVVTTLPDWVSQVVVVDDASTDRTAERVRELGRARVELICHERNQGVGAAIATGYRRALELGTEILVVMAGDAQMDPCDLPRLIEPIADGRADYVKGNRFVHPEARAMPFFRRVAGAALSSLTRAATGLAVDDTQCGFTALSAAAARELPLDELWPRYGYPNDLLGMLAAGGFRVAEVPVRPVYRGEKSGVRPWHVLSIAGVIARRAIASASAEPEKALTP